MSQGYQDMKQLISSAAKSKSTGLNEEHVRILLYNLLCSLKFLHSANVVHRDLKPQNVLFNPDCQVMICDFGLSRTLPDSCT